MEAFLEMARCGVVTVDSTDRRRSGMGEVALVLRVRQSGGLSVALLTATYLVWASGLCTMRVYAFVCTMLVFLRTPWVKASVVFRAVFGTDIGTVVGRARDWCAGRLQIAFLTELLEAVIWERAIGVKTGVWFGGEFVILGHLQGGSSSLS
jgi:hypothetical protein